MPLHWRASALLILTNGTHARNLWPRTCDWESMSDWVSAFRLWQFVFWCWSFWSASNTRRHSIADKFLFAFYFHAHTLLFCLLFVFFFAQFCAQRKWIQSLWRSLVVSSLPKQVCGIANKIGHDLCRFQIDRFCFTVARCLFSVLHGNHDTV